MKVLIIEDDVTVANYIKSGLKQSGHNAEVALTGKDGLFMAATEEYDVIVLDRMLPQVDGMTIINTLRVSQVETPVLFLSAKGELDDKLSGLRAGADDYITKPFAFEELLARLEIIVNRRSGNQAQVTQLSCGDLQMDLLTRRVTRDGQVIDLQTREFTLLEYLLRHQQIVITRTMLLENVWEYHFDPQTNLIDVHISRLRNKIEKGFAYPLIKTMRGAGYIMSADSAP